ncbi:hypothetical protein COCON_G00235330 [Conger conger]|uniref:Uncharacterized protein n=1 Tax=Conger conger TaxID=82655 RepID=A0A9Q1CUH4_CONCO|nr:hypothetical protein COCON_G00235330 [Conger conger]
MHSGIAGPPMSSAGSWGVGLQWQCQDRPGLEMGVGQSATMCLIAVVTRHGSHSVRFPLGAELRAHVNKRLESSAMALFSPLWTGRFGWLERVSVGAQWRCTTRRPGAEWGGPGAPGRRRWPAGSWAVAQRCRSTAPLLLGRGPVTCA